MPAVLSSFLQGGECQEQDLILVLRQETCKSALDSDCTVIRVSHMSCLALGLPYFLKNNLAAQQVTRAGTWPSSFYTLGRVVAA